MYPDLVLIVARALPIAFVVVAVFASAGALLVAVIRASRGQDPWNWRDDRRYDPPPRPPAPGERPRVLPGPSHRLRGSSHRWWRSIRQAGSRKR